jgi:hypothetical protein
MLLAHNKQNKNEKVPLNIPKKRPNMDGGVTLETRRCQAKSAKLREKKAHVGVQISFTRLTDIAALY